MNWSECTRYFWKKALEQEEKQGSQFKTTRQMKKWLRENIKVEALYKQTVTSKMKTAGTKKCGLCTAERRIIWKDFQDSTKSKKMLNKRSEIGQQCTCTTRFLRLITMAEKEGRADNSAGRMKMGKTGEG